MNVTAKHLLCFFAMLLSIAFCPFWVRTSSAGDLDSIKKSGVLRHLGVPYANFIDGNGSGLDAELMQLFARHLGVRYQYVRTSWGSVFGDLLGKKINVTGKAVSYGETVPVKGDIIANGLTKIPWREEVINYSLPTFPTQVWLIAKAESAMQPIVPSGKMTNDIQQVKSKLKGCHLLGKANTCLDPVLYDLAKWGARLNYFNGQLNELAPAVINGEAEASILDVPDALVALEKWPGKIKVVGPITDRQIMGVGFSKNSPRLLQAFNEFYLRCIQNGTYMELVKKYYPSATLYFPDFFKDIQTRTKYASTAN